MPWCAAYKLIACLSREGILLPLGPPVNSHRPRAVAVSLGEMFSLPDSEISRRLLFAVAGDPNHYRASAAVLAAATPLLAWEQGLQPSKGWEAEEELKREALLLLTHFCPLIHSHPALTNAFLLSVQLQGENTRRWIDVCVGMDAFVCKLHFDR